MNAFRQHNISNTVLHARTIVHIDMDCFYAQVEEIRDPSLRSKPLGIQQKSIIVTCNYIARDFGVTKLMLISEAIKLCPQLVIVNGEDLTNYRLMSNKIFDVLLKYSSQVEKLGFDENFVDITNVVNQRSHLQPVTCEVDGFIHPPGMSLASCQCGCAERLLIGASVAKEMRQDLYQTLGITSCAGISYNKLLAKLVGSRNKPNKQTVLVSNYSEDFMRELNYLHKITGIGQKTESLLLENGIGNITELQKSDINVLKKTFGAETALKLKDMSFGKDTSSVKPTGKPKTIGLEDSCQPISIRKDVEERFRLLLIRLVSQVSEDGRIPVAIKITVRKFDAAKKASHRETKQANIMPSLFKQSDMQLTLIEGGQDILLKIVMRLFDRVIDMSKLFNITLLGLSFSKFQERRNGSSSIASFLIKNEDVEVQSIMSLTNDSRSPNLPNNQFYRTRTTASPIPMHVDIDSVSISSDVSDFSENEVEPSPKKSRFGSLVAKRRCFSNVESGEIASPSKLRVSELRLNSRDSDKDFPVPIAASAVSTSSPTTANCDIITTTSACSLSNIPCPPGIDRSVFNELPLDVQNELIASWKNSIVTKATSNTSSATTPTTTGGNPTPSKNTLYRYFIRNK